MKKFLLTIIVIFMVSSLVLLGSSCKADEAVSAVEEQPAAAEETAAEETAAEEAPAEEVVASDQYIFSSVLWSTADSNIGWIVKGSEDYAALNPNVVIESTGPQDYDTQGHLEFLEAAIAKGVDGIYMHVSDPVALRPAFEKAKEAGIPIVTHTGRFDLEQMPPDLWLANVGWDETEMGAAPARYLLENYGAPVHVAAQLAHVGHAGQELRVAGFESVLPEGSKLTRLPTGDDPAEAKQIITSFFQSNPDVDVVFNTTSLAIPWVVNALEELGMAEDVIQIGTSDSAPDIEGILQGKVDFTNGVQFYLNGWYPPHVLYTYLETGLPGPKYLEQEIVIIGEDGAEAAKQMNIDVLGQEAYDAANPW